jgi:phosphate transport system substrate-binding protein
MKKAVVMFLMGLLFFVARAEAVELHWTGCGITKKAFMSELAAAYEKKTGTKIFIKGGGATKGIRAVASGEFDIGGTCRHKIDAPAEKGVVLHHVGWDALVIIVQKDNPVDNISSAQIKKVLTGEIKNWKELGGTDAPLTLYVRRGENSGVGLMAREILFNDPTVKYSPDAEVKKSSGPIEAAISRDASGIGVSGVSSAKKRKYLKMLKVDGIAPTKENIQSGAYPLYRPLYLVTQEKTTDEIKKFIAFTLGQEGQAIISAQGTVNLSEGKSLKLR